MMWRQTARLLVSLIALASVSAQVPEDSQVQTILGPIYNNGLIFNGHFTTNPATALGPLNYQWMEYETATPNNQHRGIVKFNGSASSYIDMGRTTGPNSVGITLPTFGGASLGTGDRQGVTFEVVVKFDVVANWAKVSSYVLKSYFIRHLIHIDLFIRLYRFVQSFISSFQLVHSQFVAVANLFSCYCISFSGIYS